MSEPTEYQTIFHDGRPAFVLVPVAEFDRIRPCWNVARARRHPAGGGEAHVLRGVPLIRAWREHLG